ncbi:alpha,alpha-trehalose-phosphate synthase (UDP-forming) [Ralstonia pseudosolanacearum]|uniref:alpha,alpha-trehalose-phosphate synthase (UDP-forming) n=1 Tax=Ralstonia pseudosolanacearum TaxID=1310165 RepID=UPI001FF96D31|nr:alpha,alpha-trehalose-phosphate synthase (UDP-forming) [Ralstonia pseudosolanacearum]
MRPIISTSAGTSSLAISDGEAQRADPFQPASWPRPRHPQFERLPSPPVRTRSQELRAARFRRCASDVSATPEARPRLVVVSNRLIDPQRPAAGGLAVALGDLMRDTDGLWFGWSGKTVDEPDTACVRTEPFGRTTLAQVDLSRTDYEGYYAGFSNSVLWPIFHERVKWADLNPAYFKAYEAVNRMLASHLRPMLRDSDILWVHDYHLIPFAQALRALGCTQRMGFFNHIPLPSPEVIRRIPQHRQLMRALASYDLVGMQSPRDVINLQLYWDAENIAAQSERRHDSVHAFPIGIDVESLRALVPSPASQAVIDEVRDAAGRCVLMIGVDRLDYSKGIPTRLKAFRQLLQTHARMRSKVTLVQIAAPSRQSIPAYARLRDKTEKLVREINHWFGTGDWTPVMYFSESVDRTALPQLYRMSRVGVVTPVADGMNLVAKEYVAAQASRDPGVLVLSKGAGAASQLRDALLVPSKNRAATADAYAQALSMPLEERKARHAGLMRNIETEDLRWWRDNYLTALACAPWPAGLETDRSEVTEDTRRDAGGASVSGAADGGLTQA